MSSGIALFGGTFDPIHIGHLQSALEVGQALDLDSVRLVPSFVPSHREQARGSAEHRLAMVKLAVASCTRLVVDEREIGRGGPSYTYDTLRSVRAEVGAAPLIAVMGVDSFITLPTWHKWQQLLELAHILVLDRPGWRFDFGEPLASFVKGRLVDEAAQLTGTAAGKVGRLQTTQLEISATRIRALVREGVDTGFLVPGCVREYIEQHGIYRRGH